MYLFVTVLFTVAFDIILIQITDEVMTLALASAPGEIKAVGYPQLVLLYVRGTLTKAVTVDSLRC